MLAPICSSTLRIFLLYINDSDYCYVDLRTLCPNLQVLKIENCPLIFAPNPMKSFNHLLEFEFLAFGDYYPIDMFTSFIQQNQQLEKLCIGTFLNDDIHADLDLTEYIDLSVFTKNLPNLEELRLQTVVFDDCVQGISDMKGLTYLHTLEIGEYWYDSEEVNAMLRALTTLKHLRHIWISCCENVFDQQAVIDIAVALKSLQSFKCTLKLEHGTVTEFIRHGRNLHMISMGLADNVDFTPNLIRHFAEARKLAAGVEHEPLSIHFYDEGSTDDLIQVIMNVKLKLSCSCFNGYIVI